MSKKDHSKDIEQLLTEQTAVILEAVDKRLAAQDERNGSTLCHADPGRMAGNFGVAGQSARRRLGQFEYRRCGHKAEHKASMVAVIGKLAHSSIRVCGPKQPNCDKNLRKIDSTTLTGI